jgi:hypothetical protein
MSCKVDDLLCFGESVPFKEGAVPEIIYVSKSKGEGYVIRGRDWQVE